MADKMDQDAMKACFARKTLLVTGAAGTIGKALVKQLIAYGPERIIGLNNNKNEL